MTTTPTHTCDEFCSWAITPEMLNAHGFPTRIVRTEKSMGMVFTTVVAEGEDFRVTRTRATLQAGSPFRVCFNRPPFVPAPRREPDPEVLAWFQSIRRESASV